MHFSRQMAAFVRTGIPIIDGSTSSPRARTTSASGRSCSTIARSSSARACRSPTRSPTHATILPPYYLGILRSAELTGHLDVALEQLSGYIERDLEAKSKIKSALMYPLGRARACRSSRSSILVDLRAAEVRRLLREPRRRAAAARRACCSASANFSKNFWFVFRARRASALVGVVLWTAARPQRATRSATSVLLSAAARSATSCCYSVVERFCRILGAMSQAGVPLPDAMRAAVDGAEQHRVRGAAAARAGSDARGRGPRRADRRRPGCSPTPPCR